MRAPINAMYTRLGRLLLALKDVSEIGGAEDRGHDYHAARTNPVMRLAAVHPETAIESLATRAHLLGSWLLRTASGITGRRRSDGEDSRRSYSDKRSCGGTCRGPGCQGLIEDGEEASGRCR